TRASKAKQADFARVCGSAAAAGALVDSLPEILPGSDFKAIVCAIRAPRAASAFKPIGPPTRSARAADRGIVWGIGAQVVKTGLSPILIDLMERGFVSALATNGAGVIHDFEVALAGATSEDVDDALGPGRFGMAEETGRLLNGAINDGVRDGLGIGQAVGRFLA